MAYAPAHRWRDLTEATWRDRQGLARNDPPSVRPNTANDEMSRGPGSPLPPSLFAHCGQEMSLPYTVDPGAGTGDRWTGGATGADENGDTTAQRIRPRVATMVVSPPGRLFGGNFARCTRPVCGMAVTSGHQRSPAVTGVGRHVR